MAEDFSKFSLFSMPAGDEPSEEEKNMSHNASLFSNFVPDEEPEETDNLSEKSEHDQREFSEFSDLFGHIGSLADIVKNGFVIDLDEEEHGDIIAEIMHYILPYIAPGMVELLKGSSSNLLELLERIREIMLHDPDKSRDLITELLLEELEKRSKEHGTHKRLKVRVLGNRRKVGLAFEDDIDEDQEKAAKEIAQELQKLLDRQKGKKTGLSGTASVGINDINPRATTTQRLTFQLSTGGGALMTVLLGYLLQYAAPAIINTIARGNPYLRGLMTKFDTAMQSKSSNQTVSFNDKNGGKALEANIKSTDKKVDVTLKGFGATSEKDVKRLGQHIQKSMGASKSLWQDSGPDKSGPSDPSAGNSGR